MIVPCIDLMDGKVVQLRQGRERVLEGKSPDETLDLFAGFPEIQVIDLDAAMERGSNLPIVAHLASRASVRAGGGIRTVERAAQVMEQGASRVIIGTAAFSREGPDEAFLRRLDQTVGAQNVMLALDSREGKIVVRGWQESTNWTAVDLIGRLEPYCSGFLCTYVDKEGMMQGTDLAWFRELRYATAKDLTAAGGISTMQDIEALTSLGIDCAIGMSIYTGHLNIDELRRFNLALS